MTIPRVADPQAVLDQAVGAWNRAGSSWNSAALAATYAEDALLFGGRPGHFVGREAIQGYFASYDGVILAGSMRMFDTELRVLAEGCVLAQGMVEFSFTLEGDQATRSTLRATLVLAQAVDGWLIAVHHFSSIPAVPPLGKD